MEDCSGNILSGECFSASYKKTSVDLPDWSGLMSQCTETLKEVLQCFHISMFKDKYLICYFALRTKVDWKHKTHFNLTNWVLIGAEPCKSFASHQMKM